MNSHDNWQPIETAPKDGTHILAYGNGTDSITREVGKPMLPMFAVVYWWEHKHEDFEDAGNGLFRKVHKTSLGNWRGNSFSWFNPTHWMPMPSPPTSKSAT